GRRRAPDCRSPRRSGPGLAPHRPCPRRRGHASRRNHARPRRRPARPYGAHAMSLEYGYNLAASGMLTAMFRQDVASNNLANLETTAFKPDRAFTIPRAAARIEDKLFNLPSNKLLERLGAGVLLAPTRTTFEQGA